jgi:hypothetical protein
VQIGDEEEATRMLKELAEANVNVSWFYLSSAIPALACQGMVDTLPYRNSLSPEEMKRILLGGTHPNLRK